MTHSPAFLCSSRGSCASPLGSACSRFPSCENPDAAIPPKHLFLETSKNFHSEGRYQKAEECHRGTPKPLFQYFKALGTTDHSTEAGRGQAGSTPTPARAQTQMHREVHLLYSQLQPPACQMKVGRESFSSSNPPNHAALFSCAPKAERMSVGHSFILVLSSLFKTQKVFAESRSLLWSPPRSAVEQQQLRRAPYPR